MRMWINEREKSGKFKNYKDFKNRLNDILSERMFDSLIFSGALNVFKMSKKELYEEKSSSIGLYEDIVGDLIERKYKEYDLEYLAEKEREALGFNLSVSPLEDIINYEKKHKLTSIKDLTFDKTNERIVGLVRRVTEVTTKNGDKMCFLSISDYLSVAEITVFPDSYKQYKDLLKEDEKLVLDIQSQSYGDGSWILKKAQKM